MICMTAGRYLEAVSFSKRLLLRLIPSFQYHMAHLF